MPLNSVMFEACVSMTDPIQATTCEISYEMMSKGCKQMESPGLYNPRLNRFFKFRPFLILN